MENAELYSSANGMQKKDAKEILTEFRGQLRWGEGARVLDVGCGSGDVTTEILLPLLPEGFRELVGLDLSLEMIQHARNLHSHPKVSFVQFDVAQQSDDLLEELAKTLAVSRNDGPSLDFDEGSQEAQSIRILLNNRKVLDGPGVRLEKMKPLGYDVISSFYCLHWVPDQRLAMKNVYKLLKTGGEALLVFLAKSPIFTLYRKLSSLPLWNGYMQDVDSFIPLYQDSETPLENFVEILKNTGFRILTSECRKKSHAFDSFLSLRNAIKAVNPFLPRVPVDLQEEFIEECLRQTKTLKLTEYKDGSYRVSYELIVAHVRKPA